METDSQGVIYIENWNDLCRLCLRNDQPLHNLYCDESFLVNVQEASNINICIDDTLPNSICKACVEQVNSFIEFRERCKATDEWLRNEAASNENEQKDNIEIVEIKDIWNDGTYSDNIESLSSHSDIENIDDKYLSCNDCGKDFQTSKQLTLHKKKYPVKHSKCQSCNEVILSKDVDQNSLLKKSTKLCVRCDKLKFSYSQRIQNCTNGSYIAIDGGFLCEHCNKVFKTLSSIQLHVKSYDKKQDSSSSSYKCHFCDNLFVTIQQVWLHMKSHTPGEKIKCRYCDKYFKSYLTLVRHEKKHEGSFNYVCSYCGKAFVTPYGRDRHEMTHNAAKEVQCEKCIMTFYTRAEYNRHMRYHDNIRNFLCSFCGKRFFESAHKTIHERTHTGERPFACSFCGKKFMSKQKARRHQAIHLKHKQK
ncbi:gastrula zinc finger protein XlCGF52.1-like isoform X2 [Daktulosphaira vitifoliae]|uniref:gastrula zinc finger protein XlCGF52.1-like isoform X2 n=1 Tax=Daktulosphaira vitifoliae TaxID=58002 RepID=UPI0021A97DDF|nr:gastrula zinc finger protein XlCGF52.1-like isoform X2 [Daktulosphaira vitifoliae]